MSKTADEQSKLAVADQVTDKKREYFVPGHEGGSVMARSAHEAVKKAEARTRARKQGQVAPDEAETASEAGDE